MHHSTRTLTKMRRRTHLALLAVSALAAAVVGAALTLSAAGQPFTYTDVTSRAGISFTHENGAAGARWYPELFGGGVAVLDVDADRLARSALHQRKASGSRSAANVARAVPQQPRRDFHQYHDAAAASTRLTSTDSERRSATSITTAATMCS